MHGDSLCINDKAFQYFRKIYHNRFLQKCFLRLPWQWRDKIAKRARRKSRQRKSQLPSRLTNVDPQAMYTAMQAHKVRHLIHGHTHLPGVDYFSLGGQTARRTVLSDWGPQRGNVLVCQANGKQRLEFF